MTKGGGESITKDNWARMSQVFSSGEQGEYSRQRGSNTRCVQGSASNFDTVGRCMGGKNRETNRG